jgi:acid phosphatase type 7
VNRRNFLGAIGFAAAHRKLYWSLDQPVITVREPYIQNVRQDRASVMWATQYSGTGYVEYSLDGVTYKRVLAHSRMFSSLETGLQSSFTQFTAIIPRLSPNTNYFYRTIVNSDIVGAPSRFRTAPAAGSFRFLAIGDSGMGTPEQMRVAALMAQEQASFVLHVGDIAYGRGSFADFQRNHFDVYRQIMARMPFFPALGNHEYETANAAPYLALHQVPTETVSIGERGRYYSFDWGNVHFVSLDSNADSRSNGSLRRAITGTGDMLNWLDRDLRSTRQFWRVVFFHHPPFAGGANFGDPTERDCLNHIVPILQANGVQLVLNGHEHNYQRTHALRGDKPVPDGTGTVYVTAGGGGASLYNAFFLPQTAVQRVVHHFVRIDVSGGQLTVTAVDDSGVEFDKFTITPQPVLADASRAVSFSSDPVAGSLIYVRGWNLAMQESSLQQTAVSSLMGTTLTVDDQPIPLIYVSPTQVVGQLPADLPKSSNCRVSTANGSASHALAL